MKKQKKRNKPYHRILALMLSVVLLFSLGSTDAFQAFATEGGVETEMLNPPVLEGEEGIVPPVLGEGILTDTSSGENNGLEGATPVEEPVMPLEAQDMTEFVKDQKFTLKQGDIDITGGTIQREGALDFTMSFRAILREYLDESGTETLRIQKDDYADFFLANGLKNVDTTKTINIVDEDPTVGWVATASFVEKPTAQKAGLYLRITFDGDSDVLIDHENPNDNTDSVDCTLSFSLSYNNTGEGSGEEDQTITILNKTCTIPGISKPSYTIAKEGTVNLTKGVVQWIVTVKEKTGKDLAGLKLEDDLKNVGTYVDDSFLVSADKINWNAPTGNLDPPSLLTSKLIYTFPPNAMGTQYVKFETKIPNNYYYSQTSRSIKNIVNLTKNGMEPIIAEATVSFTPQWFVKNGKLDDDTNNGIFDPANRTITWTMVANQYGATLKNVKITDILDSGMIVKSAAWAKWNGTDWDPPTVFDPLPTDGIYYIGDINSQMKLTIVAKIPENPSTTTMKNTASITWTDMPSTGGGISSETPEIGIGYNSIKKSRSKFDPTTGKATWTISIPKGSTNIPNVFAYDLLIHGGKTLKNNDKAVAAMNKQLWELGLPEVMSIISNKSVYPLHQRYAEGSFESKNGLALWGGAPIVLKNEEGQPVADLLVICQTGDTYIDTTTSHSFTYDSQYCNPYLLAGPRLTRDNDIPNTVLLFSQNMLLNLSFDGFAIYSSMLEKSAIPAVDAAKFKANYDTLNDTELLKLANADIADKPPVPTGDFFDYKDRDVIFRLNFNKNGVKFNEVATAISRPIESITLTDTLPQGWEKKNFKNGKDFFVFTGSPSAGNGSTIKATKKFIPSDGTNVNDGTISLQIGENAAGQQTITFTLQNISEPIVILLRAGPTEDKMKEILKSNAFVNQINTLKLDIKGWDISFESKRIVPINGTVLSKDAVKTADGFARWSIQYHPYGLDFKPKPGMKLTIQDELPLGADLPVDKEGNLILKDHIIVKELKMDVNGAYTPVGEPLPLEQDKTIFYDNETRILSFPIPDGTKGYEISYLTELNGPTGTIKNKAKLIGEDCDKITAEKEWKISASDSSATANRSGSVAINKTDGDGKPLANAQFSLYTADGKTLVRRGFTANDGKLTLRGIPGGDYLLWESQAPDGYLLPSTRYQVKVTKNTDGKYSSTIQKEGETSSSKDSITLTNEKKSTHGSLSITKNVTGALPELEKPFTFTLTLSSTDAFPFTITKDGKTYKTGQIKSGDTFHLKHGQSMNIQSLPPDTIYTVKEDDYGQDGYTATLENATGTIGTNQDVKLTCTNERIQAGLTIQKTVAGDTPDTAKEFTFTLALTYKGNPLTGTYPFKKMEGATEIAKGTIQNGETFTLKHGQALQVLNLPKGTAYTVTEGDYTKDHYTRLDPITGIIGEGDPDLADFLNIQNLVGNLKLTKKVGGAGADLAKRFYFTLSFPDSGDKEFAYTLNGRDAGKVRNNSMISLAHNDVAVIYDIPTGHSYKVTEADYTGQRYTTLATGDTGKIVAKETAEVVFTNTYTSPGGPVTPPDPDPKPEPDPDPEPEKPPTEPEVPPTEPEIPPTEPEIPPTEPEVPPIELETPQVPTGQTPDPTDPDSPETFVLIDENGVPLGNYHKVPTPDGSFIYVDENGVPLGGWIVPPTGDRTPMVFWNVMILLSFGLGMLLRAPVKGKKNK